MHKALVTINQPLSDAKAAALRARLVRELGVDEVVFLPAGVVVRVVETPDEPAPAPAAAHGEEP